jgi:hypothetical protein
LVGFLDHDAVRRSLVGASLGPLLGAAAILFAMALVESVRWRLVARGVGVSIGLAAALRAGLACLFLNQVAFMASGDVYRAAVARAAGAGWRRSIDGVILDRLVGVAGNLALVTIAVPMLWLAGHRSEAAVLLFLVLSLAAVAAAYAYAVHRRDRLNGQGARLLWALAIQATALIVAMLCAEAVGHSLTFADAVVSVPGVILVGMLPISIGGWGVRELAMIHALGLFGVDAEQALLVSVAMGAAMLFAGLASGAAWGLITAAIAIRGRHAAVAADRR